MFCFRINFCFRTVAYCFGRLGHCSVSCTLSDTVFSALCPRMDSDDPVYCQEDAGTITAASLSLREDERGLVETLDNLSDYGGRRLSTNVSAPGSLGRGDAWIFYKDVLQAPDWVVQAVKEGYVFPLAEEVPRTEKLGQNC